MAAARAHRHRELRRSRPSTPTTPSTPSGHVVVAGNRIESLGAGAAPEGLENVVRRIDATGHLVTPGLVNTHHHFYQWITRGLATDHNLFDWLVALYPTWARIDEQMVYAAAQGSLGMMARGGVTTAMDHHYVFPQGSGDLLRRRSSAPPARWASASPSPAAPWTAARRTAACRRTSPSRPSKARSPRPRRPSTSTTTPPSTR